MKGRLHPGLHLLLTVDRYRMWTTGTQQYRKFWGHLLWTVPDKIYVPVSQPFCSICTRCLQSGAPVKEGELTGLRFEACEGLTVLGRQIGCGIWSWLMTPASPKNCEGILSNIICQNGRQRCNHFWLNGSLVAKILYLGLAPEWRRVEIGRLERNPGDWTFLNGHHLSSIKLYDDWTLLCGNQALNLTALG